MKVNIENCANRGSSRDKAWVLGELVRNLKELRDRTDAGDMAALDEFFDLFVFSDSQSVDRKKLGNVTAPWLAIHLKTGNEYRVIGEAINVANAQDGQSVVIYERNGQTFVREAGDFQEKFKAKGGA